MLNKNKISVLHKYIGSWVTRCEDFYKTLNTDRIVTSGRDISVVTSTHLILPINDCGPSAAEWWGSPSCFTWPYVAVGCWNVVSSLSSSFWSWVRPFLTGQGVPLLQDFDLPSQSGTFVGCLSLGTQSLLDTGKIFTLMAFVWLPLSLPQCTPAMFITITIVCPFVQVSMRRNACTPLTAAVGPFRNGTQWSVLKHLPLLWTYCNSSILIISCTLINLSLGWLTKRSLQIEQGCGERIFALVVQKRQLKTGAFQNIWKSHRFTN